MADPSDPFGCFVVVALVIGLPILIVWSIRQTRRARDNAFGAIARRLKGTYVPAALLRHARIECSIAGHPARIEFIPGGEDSSGSTRLRIPLPGGAPGTLHILPDGFGQSFLKMFGAQDLEIGDQAFDAAYVVKAVPEKLALQVFSSERRGRVMAAVRHLEGLKDPRIQVTLDQLRVQVDEEIQNEVDALRLVKTAGEFLEFLNLEPAAGEIQMGALRLRPGSLCPVCGSRLEQAIVRCKACGTPHHEECWRYVGQCSTYACQEKRFVA